MPFEDGQIETGSDGRQYTYNATTNKWLPVSNEGKTVAPREAINPYGYLNPEVWADLGKTALSAPPKVAASVLGAPGDITSMVTGEAPKNVPTSEDIQRTFENVTGPLYEPKYPVSQVLEEGALMAPAMIGGPGYAGSRMATRGAKKFAERIAAPLAADVGMQHGADIDDPYARLGVQMMLPGMIRGGISPTRIRDPNIRAEADFVQRELGPYGAKLSAGQATGSPFVNYLEAQTGVPRKAGPEAMTRAHTAAQLADIGAPGATTLAPHPAGGTAYTVIPNQLASSVSPILQKYGHTPGAEQIIAARLNPTERAEYFEALRRYAAGRDLQETAVRDPSGLLDPKKVAARTADTSYGQTPRAGYTNRLARSIVARTDSPKGGDVENFVKALGGLGGAAAGLAGAGMIPDNMGSHYTGAAGAGAGLAAGTLAVPYVVKALGRSVVRPAVVNPVTQTWLKQQRLRSIPYRTLPGISERAARAMGGIVGYSGQERMREPE